MVAVLAAAPSAQATAQPAPPTRERAWIAQLSARTPAWPHPRAHGPARWLSPVGAWTGGPVGLLVLEARRGWVRVLLPTRPNDAAAWVPAERVRLRATPWRVKLDLSARLVTVTRAGRAMRRFRAVVGAPATPTPTGRFAVYEIDRQPDPFGFLGPVALHLTAHSRVLDNFGGGPGRVAIHGRGGASLLDPLGTAASHGCIRVDSVDAAWLARKVRPGVPVTVAG